MNKDRLARLARHGKVKQVLADNASAVAAVPAFAKLAAQYEQQLGLLATAARKTGVISEGNTLAKTAVGTALIARLVKAANSLYLLYKAETPSNLADAAKMRRRVSDYTAMSDQALAAEATDLAQRVGTHQAELLKDYNWDATAVTALDAAVQDFHTQLTTPQLAIDAAKIKGAAAAATLSALNVFLKDDLRAGMELLKDTHPKAYQALREASQVDDARYGKGKKGTAKAAQSFDSAELPLSMNSFGAELAVGVPPRQLSLTGAAGDRVLVSVVAEPANTAFINHRDEVTKAVQTVVSSPNFVQVGTVPCQLRYSFSLHARPWRLAFEARIEQSTQAFVLTSADLGLSNGQPHTPDEVVILLTTTPA